MQIKYFQTAWNDIKNSPGWFGKLCLLALLNFIPIFGQIVTYGYLYGWAREIAWGTHQPMPARLFSNDDGKFWRRGWFLLVIAFVFSLVPGVIMAIGSGMQSAGIASSMYGARGGTFGASAGSVAAASLGGIVYLVGWICMLLVSFLMWVAFMRTSIYDRLSAGFQLGKVWKMFRHDMVGVLKIFGMNLLVGLIAGLVLSFVFGFVFLAVIAAGIAGSANLSSLASGSEIAIAQLVLSAGGVLLLVVLLLVYFAFVAEMFVSTLTARAMGYWTMQFDVPQWRGQDDPMPFEALDDASRAGQAPVAPGPMAPGQVAPGAAPHDVAQPGTAQPGVAQSGVVQPGVAAPAEPYYAPVPDEPDRDEAAPAPVPEPLAPVAPVASEGAVYSISYDDGSGAKATFGSEADAVPAVPLDAHGAHGVDDGDAGDPDVGEHGEPQVGEPERRED